MYYHRNLPHYQPTNASFFITFRLAGSLPTSVLDKLTQEYDTQMKKLETRDNPTNKKKDLENYRRHHFSKYDDYLNKCFYGPKWLKDDRISQIVADAIHHRDNVVYELIAFCLMSNHVHMVIVQRSNTSLYRILQSLKTYTARECNKILKRSGAFWCHESYDHVIRNDKELNRIVWYVLNNPIKARLVDDWRKWKWNYCKYEMYSEVSLRCT